MSELNQTEAERRRAPKTADYRETERILGEFFIEIEVPRDFCTIADLERWRRKIILGS